MQKINKLKIKQKGSWTVLQWRNSLNETLPQFTALSVMDSILIGEHIV